MGVTWHQEFWVSEGWGPWGPAVVGVPAPHTSMPSVPLGRGAEPRRRGLDGSAPWPETPVAETLFSDLQTDLA